MTRDCFCAVKPLALSFHHFLDVPGLIADVLAIHAASFGKRHNAPGYSISRQLFTLAQLLFAYH